MKLFILLLSALFLVSCGDKNVIFNEVKSIPNETWSADNPVQFSFDISDTNTVFDVELMIRNATSYEWANLYTFVEIESPDKLVNVDTVEILLADKSGKWLGNVSGSLVTTNQTLIYHKRFPGKGNYKLNFFQAMRQPELKGVSDIGITIKQVKNEN